MYLSSGRRGIRTPDPHLNRVQLCQLSYSPNKKNKLQTFSRNLACIRCSSDMVLVAASTGNCALIYLVNSEQTPLFSVPAHLLSSAPETLNSTAIIRKGDFYQKRRPGQFRLISLSGI